MIQFEVKLDDGKSYVTLSKGLERTVIAHGMTIDAYKRNILPSKVTYDEFIHNSLGAFVALLRTLRDIKQLDGESYDNAICAFSPLLRMKKTWDEIEKFTEGEQ
ncbi:MULTISPECIES: hypothetical protein [unclassified Paenibacillus]|uniref:hypothetical protein n=1 Tax=unclassified Paenibacillus TaxID=185978 RepID=UPI00089752E9|nr:MULTISPECIES: hypothetical protein [unclassified Paenibacillus]OMC68605.1 hypothetical protein BK126_12315 [Paenibacillus sp. FSL H7-0326]SDW57466.1 hypothetical protein SAMN05518848_102233 [Paenibacillus sp. PDC88]